MLWPFLQRKPKKRHLTPHATPQDSDAAYTEDADGVTPLPWMQLGILCSLRLTEPISFFVIFPFIPALVRELGVAKGDAQVGYYAGIVESCFALSQFATVFYWGRLSDRIGRKPVLLMGLTGSALSMFCFGLSKTFAGIILSRCLNGALNGNVAVIKSVVGEISDDTNQARAYSFLPLMAALGSTIGPLIGAWLAHPVEQYPRIFGESSFLKAYPYLLPCLVAASFTLGGTLLGLCCLRETLNRRKVANEVKEGEEDLAQPLLHDTPSTPASKRDSFSHTEPQSSRGPSSVRELLTSQMLLNIFAYMMLVLSSTAYLAILPVFSYTPVELGGIGFSQHEIGIAFAIRGVLTILLQTIVFPPLCNRIGPAATFRSMVVLYLPLWACFPLMNLVARNHESRALVWILMSVTVFCWSAANIAFAANMILVTSMAPTQADLGTLHGLTQSAVSLTRSFAPFTASALFALSVDKQLLSGHFVYIFFLCTSVLLVLASWRLKEGTPAWRQHETPSQHT